MITSSAPPVRDKQIFVGSKWVEPSNPKPTEVLSPTNHELVGTFPTVSINDAQKAVNEARKAFDNGPWRTKTVRERAEYVLRFRTAFDKRSDDIAMTWSTEIGMPVTTAHAFNDMAAVIGNDVIDVAVKAELSEVRDTPAGRVRLVREAVGTVLAIQTYNGPTVEFAFTVLPALLMGNTIVVKLPVENGLVAQLIAEAVDEAGFPDGVISVITGNLDVSKYLVAHNDINLVHFTGGIDAGSEIAAVCAKRLGRVVLELGGKSAAIVTDDADFDEILPTLIGGMVTFQGQICVALTRVLVSRQRHDELVARLVEGLHAIKIGDPSLPETEYGPLPNEKVRDRALGYIERAVSEGAVLATAEKVPDLPKQGFFLEPTLLTNVDNSMEVAQNEVFGPVFAVIPYDDIDDAVRIANDTKYGLAAAVFSQDEALAGDIAARMDVGACAINGNFPCLTAPFGGIKRSGYGRVSGLEGLMEFTNQKQIVLPTRSI